MIGPQLLRRFDDLLHQVESVDLRVPEDSALIGLATDLQPRVSYLLRSGHQLLAEVEAELARDLALAEPDGRSDTAELRHIGMMISAEIAGREITDLAFFARSDVRAALDTLVGAATRRDALMAASTCESGLRRLRKALVSVESAIFELLERPAPDREWMDIEVSLEIRKLFAALRREVGTAAEERPLEDRLRSVLYRTVAFRELRIYPFLRVDDRVLMRRLLSRILGWLNSSDRDPLTGRRLWQDLHGFVEILSQVSYRQELQEHDRSLLYKAYRGLFPAGGGGPEEVSLELLTEMQRLEGLDPELDALLLARAAPAALWHEPLVRLLASLAHGATGSRQVGGHPAHPAHRV